MKKLVGKKVTKKVDFMGDKVEIIQLSLNQVKEVQKIVKASQETKNEEDQFGLLRDVIRISVIGADELTDEDFNTFPVAELNNLVNSVLEYSGLGSTNQGN
jgi:hypothetical protein